MNGLHIPTTAIIINDGVHSHSDLNRAFNHRPFTDHLSWLASVGGRVVTPNTDDDYLWIRGICDKFEIRIVQTEGVWRHDDAIAMCDQWILIVEDFESIPSTGIFELSSGIPSAFKCARNGWLMQINPRRGGRRPRVHNVEFITV